MHLCAQPFCIQVMGLIIKIDAACTSILFPPVVKTCLLHSSMIFTNLAEDNQEIMIQILILDKRPRLQAKVDANKRIFENP